MGHLGNFGKPMGAIKAKPEELDTIGLGEPATIVRLKPVENIPSFVMMEFARMVAIGIPAKDMTSMSIVYGVLEGCVLEDDFPRVRMAMLRQGDEGLADLVMALYERWAEVPLGGSAPSSDGASETQESPSDSSRRPSKRAKRRARSETPEQIQARLEAAVLGKSSAESPQESSTQ